MDDFEKMAISAAMHAGKIQRENYKKQNAIYNKGEINIVTDIDIKCEKIIKETILHNFPAHAVLAEESEEIKTNSQYRWIIDPLDGTTNFAHGYPCFCVSIALEKEGAIILGVIFDPIREELFTARKGAGAFLNGEKIRVSDTDLVTKSLIVTGFPYDIRENPKNNLNYFFKMSLSAQGVRRDGSAALDLAYVACGRFDGFWELKLAPWDVAAGMLILAEAGGKVTGLNNNNINIFSRELVASNGKIHREMLEILKSI